MSGSRYFGSALACALLGYGGIALGQDSAQEACESDVIDTDACLDALEVTEQQTREQQEAAEEAAETAQEVEQSAREARRPAGALGADAAPSAADPNAADPAQAPAVADARARAAGSAPAPGAASGQDAENGAPTQAAAAASTTPAVDETEAMGLVGNDVKTRLEESVGEVTRVVKSRASSDLVAVADIGGFLGFGVHTVALPIEETRIDAEGNLVTDLSREELELMPAFDPRDYAALQ
jgi:hypothetical protein